MITIKNKAALLKMEYAGQLVAQIVDQLTSLIKPGVTTYELDMFIEAQLVMHRLESKTKGFHGYRHTSCISVNDVVVHGVPKKETVLVDGDLVKVDVCASWKGYCADMARQFFVGIPSMEAQRLVEVAQNALEEGIKKAVIGNRVSDISCAIQKEVESNGFGVVRDFAGHGIGKQMHEDPEVLNYGQPGQGPILRPGMALAIEPMITAGHFDVYVADDGWTVKTKDKSLAAHVEDTVVITENGPRIMTRLLRKRTA